MRSFTAYLMDGRGQPADGPKAVEPVLDAEWTEEVLEEAERAHRAARHHGDAAQAVLQLAQGEGQARADGLRADDRSRRQGDARAGARGHRHGAAARLRGHVARRARQSRT